MADQDRPQIYLVTPPELDLDSFPDRLAAVLDATEIACLRIALATRDEDRILRASDAIRHTAHARDVAVVIERHVLLVERLGLDEHHDQGARRARRVTRRDPARPRPRRPRPPPLSQRLSRASLAHQLVQLLGLETFLALRVGRHAVALACLGELLDRLPQQRDLVFLARGAVDQAAHGL